MSAFEAKATQLSNELDAQVERVDTFVSANEEKLLGDRDKVDYMGNVHESVKAASDANVDWLLGEVNTAHYEGQHITATDTIEGRAKSAISKGQTKYMYQGVVQDTFVHVVKFVSGQYLDPQTGELIDGQPTHVNCAQYFEIPSGATTIVNKGNSNYKKLCLYDSNKNYIIGDGKADGGDEKTDVVRQIPSNAKYFRFSTSRDSTQDERCYVYIDGVLVATSDVNIERSLINCKMPVLTTIGKNLFDREAFYNDWKGKQAEYIYKETVDGEDVLKIHNLHLLNHDKNGFKIFVEKDVPLTLTFKCKKAGTADTNAVLTVRYGDKTFKDVGSCNSDVWTERSATFTPTRNYITICSAYIQNDYYYIKDIQLEQGTQKTSYEPFKSNILSAPEDVELRGIGEIKDELDLQTGKLTQRIGEMVLDGSEDWEFDNSGSLSSTNRFYTIKAIMDDAKFSPSNTLNDAGLIDLPAGTSSNDSEHICIVSGKVYIRKNKTEYSDLNAFKNWLSSNPMTVQYQLATESVKTVDLSDNVVYSYDEVTHYDCFGEEGSLVPTLSVDIPTNLSAIVSRQRATIETQKEQIQTLEVENEQLIAQNEIQDEDIALNQDAINYMLFASEMLVDDNSKTKGVNTMAAYLANQILKGKLDYVLVVTRYAEFKEDIDTILILEGKQDLIK